MVTELSKPVLLVFPFGYLSHYLRCLALTNYLRHSFTVLFAGHRDFNAFIASEGFKTFDCLSFNEAEVLDKAKKFDFSWLDEKTIENVFLSQVAAIKVFQPAAILGDACPTLRMAAEKSEVTYISLQNGYMSKYYAETRTLSRTHPAYALLSYLPSSIAQILTAQGESMAFRSVHAPFRKLRMKYGLKITKTYLDEMEGDYNLICDLPKLFPQKQLPPNHTVIGPLLYQSPVHNDLLSRLDPAKQTIFVSMGSTGNWHSVSFLNDHYFRRYNIVAAADKEHILSEPHIIRADFVNVNDLFPHTSLVICHGGNGTIYQALQYGIPLLCHTAHFEQEWNVQAIEKHELGRSVNHMTDIFEIRDEIEYWISRKDTDTFTLIRQQVNNAIACLEPKIQHIAPAILTKHFVEA